MRQTYRLCTGGVQCYVAGFKTTISTSGIYHFGAPEYDSKRPILSESKHEQAQPIVDALNAGTMTEAEAMKQLDGIYL